MAKSKQHAIKAIILLWLGAIAGGGLGFIVQVLLARRLSPGPYGAFVAAMATVTTIVPLAGFGVGSLWLKVFGIEGWNGRRWLLPSFKFLFLSSIFSVMLLLIWARWGNQDDFTRKLLILLIPVVLGQASIDLLSARFQLEERYTILTLWQALPHLSRLVVILIAAIFGFSALDIGIGFSLVACLLVLISCRLLLQMLHGSFNLKGHETVTNVVNTVEPRGVTQIEIFREAWHFGVSGLLYLIFFQSNIILLNAIAGSKAAGIYNVAFTVMAAVYLLPASIYQKFLLPKIHRWAEHDKKHFLAVYHVGNGRMLVLGGIFSAILLCTIPWCIPLFFGKKYQDAVSVLMILAICPPIRFLETSVGAALVTQNHMRRKNLYQGIVAVFNVLLNLALIPYYGIYGAAWTTVASETLLLALYLLGVRKYVFGDDALRGWRIKFKSTE